MKKSSTKHYLKRKKGRAGVKSRPCEKDASSNLKHARPVMGGGGVIAGYSGPPRGLSGVDYSGYAPPRWWGYDEYFGVCPACLVGRAGYIQNKKGLKQILAKDSKLGR